MTTWHERYQVPSRTPVTFLDLRLDDKGLFSARKSSVHIQCYLNVLSVCNQISEQYNISQFQMLLMSSQIHLSCYALSSFKQHCFILRQNLSLLVPQRLLIFVTQTHSDFPFEHLMAFQLPLTTFGSTGDFSNKLQSRIRPGILLGAGARPSKIRQLRLRKRYTFNNISKNEITERLVLINDLTFVMLWSGV